MLYLTLSGCRVVKYKFMEDVSEISNVEIVKLIEIEKKEDVVVDIKIETICVVTNKEAFIEDFGRLKCWNIYADPIGINEGHIGSTILKIQYLDGKYELISNNARATYGETLIGMVGEYNMYADAKRFNEQEFNELLEKYMQ